MEKLFNAIRDQHSGCEVVDVRFLADQYQVDDQDVDKLDCDLAKAISNAESIELTEL